MKIHLFHVPYADEAGMQRQRIAALVTGADVAKDSDVDLIGEIADGIKGINAGTAHVLAVEKAIEVAWL